MSAVHDQSSSFSIKGDAGAEIRVSVLGYERLNATDISDANWLNAEIAFNSGGCSFHYTTNITTNDIKYFLTDLEKALSESGSRASFLTDEEGIVLHLEFSRLGEVNIVGELKDTDFSNARVSFEMSNDQSYFSSVCSDLHQLTQRYPIIESVA